MRNLAGCPVDFTTEMCRKELEIAGIPVVDNKPEGEVKSLVAGELNGWRFERCWYYWSATTETNPLPMAKAKRVWALAGRSARTDGHCMSPRPDKWWSQDWQKCDGYHIDTLHGLLILVATIRGTGTRVKA